MTLNATLTNLVLFIVFFCVNVLCVFLSIYQILCVYFKALLVLNFTPSLNTAIRETTEYKHFIHPVDKALDQNLSQGYKPMKNLRCTCTLTNLQLLQSPRCMCKSLRHFPGTSPLNYFEPLQHLCKLEGFVWCTLKTKYCILGFWYTAYTAY